ncbi:NKG2-D type II integral membrane protein [Echinops telfairi]|uniref:NKG2-D type II integral membrane protein n=1 Tax=Echinops telfairi TaxID=9371 RepID=A0ABM0J985_ECHTE|nr:NKG2-D type II integral membrane protein [Echinops telfairi]
MESTNYMMGLIRDRKSHQDLGMNKCYNCNVRLAKYDTSTQCQRRRSPLIPSNYRENSSQIFLGRFIAVAMGIRFVVMVTIWSIIFINSPFNQESTIPLNDSYCGPCPNNWICYRKNCYKFSNESKNWYQSRASCESQNSSLLKIYNREDQDFFKLVKSYHWMGLVQTSTNGSWQWHDGSFLSHNQLTIVEMQKGTCAVYGSNFKGYTENCSVLNTYICMQRIV